MKTKWNWPIALVILMVMLVAAPIPSASAATADFTFTASPSPSGYNQTVTFTLSATGDDPTYPPFGYVDFFDNGSPICQTKRLNLTSGGMPAAGIPATCTTASLQPGTHVITANFISMVPSSYPNTTLTLAGGHTVNEPVVLNISPASLPDGTYGAYYNQLLSASYPDGTSCASCTWGFTGDLPFGIYFFSEDGSMFGKPTSLGTYTFTLTATASDGAQGSREYTIQIGKATPSVSVPDITKTILEIGTYVDFFAVIRHPSNPTEFQPDGTVSFSWGGSPIAACTNLPVGAGGYVLCSHYVGSLTSGDYAMQANFTPSAGMSAYYTSGSGTGTFRITEPNFKVAGVVFHDINEDGVRDKSPTSLEIPLENMVVSLDRGCDGTNDDLVWSNAAGYFVFNDLPGGATYCLDIEAWANWEQSTPTNPFVLNSDKDFEVGFFVSPLRYYIWGNIFDDKDQDGVQEDGEPGLYDWTVYLDQGCDGQVDYTTTTSYFGSFMFPEMPENRCYRITEVVKTGWQQMNTLDDFWLTGTMFELNIGNYYPDIIIHPEEPTLPDGTIGLEYNLVFTASGGTEPYTFTTIGDDLPDGLAMSPEGVLSGTPTELGYFSFFVHVEDANHAAIQWIYYLAIKTNGVFNLTTSSNPSVSGEGVTFTFTGSGDIIDPDFGPFPPLGVVTFYDGETVIAGCEYVFLNFDPVLMEPKNLPAACTTSALADGAHEIRAVFSDYSYYHNADRTLSQVVGAPALTHTTPAAINAGSGAINLGVFGSSFAADAVVRWNGTDLATTFVSSSELAAAIPAGLLAGAQTAQITVFSDEMASRPLLFFVTDAPVGVTGQDVGSGEDPVAAYGQATAAGTGSGLLAVAEYDANPGGTPGFTASGTYFDVYASPDSSFSAVEITFCGLGAGDVLFWWDGTQWLAAAPQTYDAASGCITLVVTDSSSPTITQLQGTYFVAGLDANSTPTADPGGPYLVGINTAISMDGSLSSDPDGDPLSYLWDVTAGTFADNTKVSPAYTAGDTPGLYVVCLTVNDGTATSEPACTLVVVYDPSAGFVTGGGWIDSLAGAYVPDPTLSGKATFGFVSRYKKGASVPTGNTEFQFAAGGFSFHATDFDWLLVGKDKVTAQFKGTGTVNGALDPNGNAYKFLLWAGDGTGPNGLDTFRIRIWWEGADGVEHVVYDNGFAQEIGGGSIVVHAVK